MRPKAGSGKVGEYNKTAMMTNLRIKSIGTNATNCTTEPFTKSHTKLIRMVQASLLVILMFQSSMTIPTIHGFVPTYSLVSSTFSRNCGVTSMVPSQRLSSSFHITSLRSSTSSSKNDPSQEKLDDTNNDKKNDNNNNKDESQSYFMSPVDTSQKNVKHAEDDIFDLFEEDDKIKSNETISDKQESKPNKTIAPKPIMEEINSISITSNNSFNKTTNKTSSVATSSPYMIQSNKEEYVGIGGRGGYIYDVNKLKSNLVQKSIKQFKMELLQLLIDTTDEDSKIKTTKDDTDLKIGKKKSYTKNELIDQKISALVSSNPVSTTTDSNLLEGGWDFAYSTNNAVDILEDSRVVLSKSKSKHGRTINRNKDESSSSWKLKPYPKGTIFQSWSRHICLERLEDDEDPYMIDCTSHLNGLSVTERRYKIVGVSKKSVASYCFFLVQYFFSLECHSFDLPHLFF